MKNLFFLLFSTLFFSFASIGQTDKGLTISSGVGLTSRIVGFTNDHFTEEELNTLQELEVPKPSYHLQVGYSTQLKSKHLLHFGIGARHTRFGTKIYTVPSRAINTTPQYSNAKKVIIQNQQFLFLEYGTSNIKLLKSAVPSLKISLFRNSDYKMFRASYREDNQRGIIGIMNSDSFLPYRYDINIALALKYRFRYKEKETNLYFKPYISAFLKPYEVSDMYNNYLFFYKDSSGYLWDFGVLFEYQL